MQTAEQFQTIAAKYAPPYIKIRYKRKRNGRIILKPAHACIRREEILTPRPVSPEALAFFLHECAHFHLRHFAPHESQRPLLRKLYTGGETKTLAEQEYAAERYAIETMKREGVPVPRNVLAGAKLYVAECLEFDTLTKRSPRHVKRWIR